MDFIQNKYGYHRGKLSTNELKVYNTLLDACLKKKETGNVWITDDINIQNVINALKYDNPGLCYVDFVNGILFKANTFKITYLDYDLSKIDAVLNKIYESVEQLDTYSKIMYIHDYLCSNTFYDFDAMNDYGKINHIDAFNLYGCLVKQYCVCDGLGQAFSYILNKLDITNFITIGDLNGVPHCCNAVKFDDCWFYIDVTSDMRERNYSFSYKKETIYPIKHIFFGLTDEDLISLGYKSDDFVVEASRKYNYYENNDLVFSSFPEIRKFINKLCHRKDIINFRYDGKLDINDVRDRLFKILNNHCINGVSIYTLSEKFISIIGGDLYECKH